MGLQTAVAAALAMGFAGTVGAGADTPPPEFQGRYIAAISDADMRAMAYIDGQLGQPRGRDALSIIALPLDPGARPTGTAEVSNSVINPVFSIAASADGDTIFVAETRGPRAEGAQVMGDLPPGTILRAVDVTDPVTPRIAASVEVGFRPKGVDLSADGETLALATDDPERQLTFVRHGPGGFGTPRRIALPDMVAVPEFLGQGLTAHHVEWHPTEDIVAVAMNTRAQVQFYQVARDAAGEVAGLTPWGNRIQTSKWPMSGKFSPDGRFFVTNDLQWGADVRGFYVNAPPAQLTVIELADLAAEAPRHFVVGGLSVPRHAESLAFSRDGRRLVTLNIGQSWLAPGEVGHSLSSMSLIDVDLGSGQLRLLSEVEMPQAELPEGIAFDASGRYVVAGVYEYRTPDMGMAADVESALEVWEVVEEDDGARLVQTGFWIATTPGTHSLVVVD